MLIAVIGTYTSRQFFGLIKPLAKANWENSF